MANQLNMDVVRRRRAEIAREAEERESGANFDKLKEGPNKRRILPPWSAEGNWRKHAAYHYNVVDKRSLVCPKKTYQRPCPICEFVDTLYKSGTAEDKETARKYRAKDRFFSNVLNLDLNDGKVYVMAFGVQLEESIIDEMDGGQKGEAGAGDQFGAGDITNPKTGRNLLVTKTVPEKKEQTSYKAKASGVQSEVPNFAALEKNLVDLDALVQKDLFSYEELSRFLMGEKPAEPVAAPAKTETTAAGVTSDFVKPASNVDEFGNPTGGASTVPATETKASEVAAPAAKPVSGASAALERLRAMKAAGK